MERDYIYLKPKEYLMSEYYFDKEELDIADKIYLLIYPERVCTLRLLDNIADVINKSQDEDNFKNLQKNINNIYSEYYENDEDEDNFKNLQKNINNIYSEYYENDDIKLYKYLLFKEKHYIINAIENGNIYKDEYILENNRLQLSLF